MFRISMFTEEKRANKKGQKTFKGYDEMFITVSSIYYCFECCDSESEG